MKEIPIQPATGKPAETIGPALVGSHDATAPGVPIQGISPSSSPGGCWSYISRVEIPANDADKPVASDNKEVRHER